MAQVNGPTPAGIYHDGRGNQILSCTEVKTIMFRYTDADGKESIALFYVFGEADYGKAGKPEDRMVGIWLGANFTQLNSQLKLVTKHQAQAMLAKMEEKGLVRDGKLVDTSSAPVELPDVSGIFDDLNKEGAGEGSSTPE